MKAQHLVFTEPNKVELLSFEFPDAPGPEDVFIEISHSLVSPGTELACLSGTESWARIPFLPGYAGVGQVIAVGDAVGGDRVGDTVFSYTKHASIDQARVLTVPVPTGLDPLKVVFARMAAVSITALRVSQAEMGDHVAVIGLGLVGNLAAQLFTLAGCDVIGIDLSARRCQLALECGVRHAINPREVDQKEFIADVTGGAMCETVVEAIGLSPVAVKAGELAGKQGEVILLGSPRAPHETDVTPLLQTVHLWNAGCISYKGAHEWRYPRLRDEGGWAKHSIQRNVEIILGLIAEGRLAVELLLTHVLSPRDAASGYVGLRDDKDGYMGVVLNWTELD